MISPGGLLSYVARVRALAAERPDRAAVIEFVSAWSGDDVRKLCHVALVEERTR